MDEQGGEGGGKEGEEGCIVGYSITNPKLKIKMQFVSRFIQFILFPFSLKKKKEKKNYGARGWYALIMVCIMVCNSDLFATPASTRQQVISSHRA